MEPKKEETKKKAVPKTTTQKKKTTSSAAKKTMSSVKSTATKKSSTTSKKNTTTKTSTSKTQAKKSSTPKTNVSSTKTSTSTTKKNPSKKTTTTKKSTPSKQTTSKTKKSTNSKTTPVKVVPKKEIKTSLDKEIETPHEEPIKIATSNEKIHKQSQDTKQTQFDITKFTDKIRKVVNKFVQILKQFFLKLMVLLKKLKPIKQEEVEKEPKEKIGHKSFQGIKQFFSKCITVLKNRKPTKKEKKVEEEKVLEELPSETPIQTKKKKKGKWLFFIIVILLLVLFMLIPYGKDVYLSGASNKNLEAPKFMKLKEECCSYTATFSSPRSVWSLKKDIEQIMNNYKVLQCDNHTYYYNENENYTITDYSFKKGILFNQLSITYGIGNSCDIDTKFKKLEVLSDDFSIEDAKKDGNYVVEDGKVYNKEAYTNFMDQVSKNFASTLRIVTTNENKDVLITDVEYKNGKYTVSYDGTRDKNSKNNKSIIAYKFEHLKVSNGKLYAYNGDELKIKDAKKYETYYLLDVE